MVVRVIKQCRFCGARGPTREWKKLTAEQASVKGRRRLESVNGAEVKLKVDTRTNRICPACREGFAAILQESDVWEQYQREQEEEARRVRLQAPPLLHQLHAAVKNKEGVFAVGTCSSLPETLRTVIYKSASSGSTKTPRGPSRPLPPPALMKCMISCLLKKILLV